MYTIDERVEIYALKKNLDLNGKIGIICRSKNNNRYGVLLDNNRKILIKSNNIRNIVQNLETKIYKKKYFWCLHEDCLLSLDCYETELELSNHMKIHDVLESDDSVSVSDNDKY